MGRESEQELVDKKGEGYEAVEKLLLFGYRVDLGLRVPVKP